MHTPANPPASRSGRSGSSPRRSLVIVVAALALVCSTLAYVRVQETLSGSDLEKAGATAVESEIKILGVRGSVDYRRGERGAWTKARTSDRLAPGDWIKTAEDGSARVRLADASTFVLGPRTLAKLGSSGASLIPSVAETLTEFRWFDEPPQTHRRSSPPPRLVSPSQAHGIDLVTQGELRLAWTSVPGAARYALNVSGSQSFDANIIEDNDRRIPSARLGIRGEGLFYWRVAAVDRDGQQGAWSETRSFRVASSAS